MLGSKRARILGGLVLFVLLVAGGAWWAVPSPVGQVRAWPVSPVLLDNKGDLIHAKLSVAGEWCLPIPLAEMGEWLPVVLVAVEDKRFYSHSGVDLLALGRALAQNVQAGKVVSGASTISSQLVRISLPRERSFFTKAQEFIGAWKLEQALSKQDILEYYLNRAPFGGPIRGVEAAARLYFGKKAKDLSLGEAALLVGMLKGPTAYRPDRNPKAATSRKKRIIAQVAAQTGLAAELTALALAEPLPVYRPAMPAKAWHFAGLAFSFLPQKAQAVSLIGDSLPHPGQSGGIIHSTLDMRTQAKLEQALQAQLRQAPPGVTAAGIVVDNKTAAILGYVGNARFAPQEGQQWVDCALALRSPGSILKPFIYLSALEKGLLIPASLIADTPLHLGGEAPRNFDKQYRGPVTVHTALTDSLNTPAVRVLRKIGLQEGLRVLREAGFTSLTRPVEEYGDSLVLGAGEVSLLEIARAYTTLANLGQDRPLALLRTEVDSPGSAPGTLPSLATLEQIKKGNPPKALYSQGGAFLIAEMLKDPGRLSFLAQIRQEREEQPIAFKTGTSYGLRDAWTAAYSPGLTVVVWFGIPSGAGANQLTGISLAAPVALSLVEALSGTKQKNAWYTPPEGVSRTEVCALSGVSPGAFCPAVRKQWYLPAVWRTVPCPMHISRNGKATLVWPPELEDYHRKRFAVADVSRAITIASPLPGASYLITPGVRTQPLPLKAEGARYPLHWYIDGQYIGEQAEADAPLYWTPTPGVHTMAVLDADERTLTIKTEVIDLGAQTTQDIPLF